MASGAVGPSPPSRTNRRKLLSVGRLEKKGGTAPQKQQQLLKRWRPVRPAHSPGRPGSVQPSGTSQVQRPRDAAAAGLPARALCEAVAAAEAGQVAPHGLQAPGGGRTQGAANLRRVQRQSIGPASSICPGVRTDSGRPSTMYPQSKGGAGTADRERPRPRIKIELCASTASQPGPQTTTSAAIQPQRAKT